MAESNLTITEAAVEKIVGAKSAEDRPQVALRITAREEGAKFRYELKLVAMDTKTDDAAILSSTRSVSSITMDCVPSAVILSHTRRPTMAKKLTIMRSVAMPAAPLRDLVSLIPFFLAVVL